MDHAHYLDLGRVPSRDSGHSDAHELSAERRQARQTWSSPGRPHGSTPPRSPALGPLPAHYGQGGAPVFSSLPLAPRSLRAEARPVEPSAILEEGGRRKGRSRAELEAEREREEGDELCGCSCTSALWLVTVLGLGVIQLVVSALFVEDLLAAYRYAQSHPATSAIVLHESVLPFPNAVLCNSRMPNVELEPILCLRQSGSVRRHCLASDADIAADPDAVSSAVEPFWAGFCFVRTPSRQPSSLSG